MHFYIEDCILLYVILFSVYIVIYIYIYMYVYMYIRNTEYIPQGYTLFMMNAPELKYILLTNTATTIWFNDVVSGFIELFTKMQSQTWLKIHNWLKFHHKWKNINSRT